MRADVRIKAWGKMAKVSLAVLLFILLILWRLVCIPARKADRIAISAQEWADSQLWRGW